MSPSSVINQFYLKSFKNLPYMFRPFHADIIRGYNLLYNMANMSFYNVYQGLSNVKSE
jgi:hypothetical protein